MDAEWPVIVGKKGRAKEGGKDKAKKKSGSPERMSTSVPAGKRCHTEMDTGRGGVERLKEVEGNGEPKKAQAFRRTKGKDKNKNNRSEEVVVRVAGSGGSTVRSAQIGTTTEFDIYIFFCCTASGCNGQDTRIT